MPEDPVVTKIVYPITWPETQAIEKRLRENRPEAWYEHTYRRGHADVHKKLLDGWREWSGVVLGDAFPNAYATFGATDAIKECFALKCGTYNRIEIFAGDYEDYWNIGRDRKGEATYHPFTNLARLQPTGNANGTFIVSIPRALDGEYWDGLEFFLAQMSKRRRHLSVILDLTYVGVVKEPMLLDIAKHENVTAVIFSLSKAFGVYFHRIGGIFSRYPMPIFERNESFKNLFSLELGAELIKSYRVDELPKKYAPIQEQALAIAKEKGAVPASAIASNAVLLARSTEGLEEHKRCDGHYRYCLTPTMEKLIRGS